MERLELPVYVGIWVLVEASNVLECSPFLGHVSRLPGRLHELGKVSIGFLSEGSIHE